MKTVWLKFVAFSNISYKHEWDTGYTREEYDALSSKQRTELTEEAIWEDIDCYEVDKGSEL